MCMHPKPKLLNESNQTKITQNAIVKAGVSVLLHVTRHAHAEQQHHVNMLTFSDVALWCVTVYLRVKLYTKPQSLGDPVN